MDGFSTNKSCGAATHYICYQQFWPSQIPNLAALARNYVISDRTYELDAVPSWGAHMDLVSATLDGFTGINPQHHPGAPPGPEGWGCDSHTEAFWKPRPSARRPTLVPSCIPKRDGSGPFRRSPVKWVPTIMGRLQAKGISWRLYTPTKKQGWYGFAICPTFAACIYSKQRRNMVPMDQVVSDARHGHLPGYAVVTPMSQVSQHNDYSMKKGDNWIGEVVSAIQHGPQWRSTAIFITYDDCGCFYDHASPPRGLGIRVPMVIVSPWAKRRYTDHHVASFASLLAFTEHTFGLRPLRRADRRAYAYGRSFDFRRRRNGAPLHPPRVPKLRPHRLPRWELRHLARMPPNHDFT
jgi:phospholipase C